MAMMLDREVEILSPAAIPAHEIRRYESAVWSLYMLSENPSIKPYARAACRFAADFAVKNLNPGDRAVTPLMELVIEVGGGEVVPSKEALLARLRAVGWQGSPAELDKVPEPLEAPPTRSIVSDKLRQEAFERILAAVENHLHDQDLGVVEKKAIREKLAEVRSSKADIRTKTQRAWELLDWVERNLYMRTRETGVG